MDSLARLFGSALRVKLLRLFLFNTDASYTVSEAAKRTRAGRAVAAREVASLAAGGALRRQKQGAEVRYGANPRYRHLAALEGFLRSTDGLNTKRIREAFRSVGALRLLALSGFFTAVPESKVDLLVVGDNLNERGLERAVSALEADLGREIRYAAFATPDFRYRLGIYDRLVRDVLDYPHRFLVDKIGL